MGVGNLFISYIYEKSIPQQTLIINLIKRRVQWFWNLSGLVCSINSHLLLHLFFQLILLFNFLPPTIYILIYMSSSYRSRKSRGEPLLPC